MAFSISSASRCTTSDTACPETMTPGWILERHPAVLLDFRGRGPGHVGERNRLAPLPRTLVPGQQQQVLGVPAHPGDQVVHREQVGQPAGSSSFCSSESIIRTSRSISDWLRRDKLTNIALKLRRSSASFPASRTASACTWSNARATWPISSTDSTSIGATSRLVAGSGVSPSCRTRSGSCTVAISSAPSRSLRSGRTRDLATTKVASSTRIKIAAVRMAMNSADRSAPRCRTWARATMFPATPSSTVCIRSIVSDIDLYH